ncbi:MAG TPA: hypothetical protein VE593_08355 [Nitrososphaeraceae archaeon]|nr:hypothetical protein [Nitrososphaeraceae archaeon]
MHRSFNVEREEKRTKRIFIVIFYFSAVIMLAIAFYALYVSATEYFENGKIVIGEVLVDTEFPFHGLTKLVTYLMVVSVICWYSAIKLLEDRIANMTQLRISLFQLIAIAVAVIALYEFIYNFIVWNSFIAADAIRGFLDLDNINLAYPNYKTPWNLVFATKMTLAAFLISAHAFYIGTKYNTGTDEAKFE